MTGNALLQQDSQALSLREELRQATREEHEQLEVALDLMRPDISRKEYCELLAKYHGFYQAFESFLREDAAPDSAAVQFYIGGEGRWKLTWLADDLRALDCLENARQYQIPQTHFHSLFPSSPYLLGAVYVIEGSMLGGMVLSRHFSRVLGLSPQTGLKFFSGYGVSTKSHWQALLHLIETWPVHDRREEVILGAKRMFSFLHDHMLQPAKQ